MSKNTKTSIVQRIATYLNGRKTPATTTQIVKAIGGNATTITNRVGDLVRAGKVSSAPLANRKTNGRGRPAHGFTIIR